MYRFGLPQAFRRIARVPLADRGPLRIAFITTDMTVGGAEMLLYNLIRSIHRERILPELYCTKELGELGEALGAEIPAFGDMARCKYDINLAGRLAKQFRERRVDGVVTVGTGGDRMFWGRLAGLKARLPVIISALHATGLPDYVEWQNRLLNPLTDAFIALAKTHAEYVCTKEGCPRSRVHVIHNGIDTDRFQPLPADAELRNELGLRADSPVVTILAQLRPEKNHKLFLEAASIVRNQVPAAEFLIVGEGPCLAELQSFAVTLGIAEAVRFCGRRTDVPEIFAISDVVTLTSQMEASPVSILEALACERPVVATHVGSIPELVDDGRTGYLVPPASPLALADRVVAILQDDELRERLGRTGREKVVEGHSLANMTGQYEDLIVEIYNVKCPTAEPIGDAPTEHRVWSGVSFGSDNAEVEQDKTIESSV